MRLQSNTLDVAIAKAVDQGLSTFPKSLPSWLFYDAQGDKIFQSIMRMPEYYPTTCEYEIVKNYRTNLANYFTEGLEPFDLIELGPGDGVKTQLLLECLLDIEASFTYVPVDVSVHVLDLLKNRLISTLPKLDIQPHSGRYEESLQFFGAKGNRKVILFLGANIGNYSLVNALQFIERISASINRNDFLLVGFDLKKDPRIIQSAYDDSQGITRAFNLNLLTRLNRELGARFSADDFNHFPFYDPVTATAKSFLISLKDQDVYIEALNKSFHFNAWETVHTEVSQKYDLQMIEELASTAKLQIENVFYDKNKYFADVLFSKQ